VELPFFSIIIPTFNRLNKLKRALDSVLRQTYRNYEIIIIDDGSTDGTDKYIAQLSESNDRIRYRWIPNSGLPAVARNHGIEISGGNYICFLDSDDYWKESKLADVAACIEKYPEAAAISHNEDEMVKGHYTRVLYNRRKIKGSLYEDLLFRGNFLSTSAMTVKREVLQETGLFNTSPEFCIVEDYDLWLRIAQKGTMAFINKSLGCCVVDDEGISSDIERLHENLRNVVTAHICGLDRTRYDIEKLMKIHHARIDYYKGRSYQMKGDFEKAIPVLRESIIKYPFAVKKWISLLFVLLRIKK